MAKKKCPKCGTTGKNPKDHYPACPIRNLAKKNKRGGFAK